MNRGVGEDIAMTSMQSGSSSIMNPNSVSVKYYLDGVVSSESFYHLAKSAYTS